MGLLLPYPFLSLFSGAGFLDLGFWLAGFRPLVAVEKDPAMARLYRESFLEAHVGGEVLLLAEDIRRLSSAEILEAMESLRPGVSFEGFGVVGGPPCQDFSLGGKHRGVQGERGELVWDFLRKVEALAPTFFLFENVKGLVAVRRHRLEAFDALVEAFAERGYRTEYRLLNALEYGLPQDRERVFVVGFREDVWRRAGLEGFPWPSPTHPGAKALPWPKVGPAEPSLPAGLPKELTVGEAFRGVDGLPNHEDQLRPRSPRIGGTPEGDTRGKSFKRLHRHRYAPTVAYGHNEVHIHPTEPRRISVREAMRLQGVPDWYAFPPRVPLSKKYTAVSNGVPVPLAQRLAEAILEVLEGRSSLEGEKPRECTL